MDASDYEKPIVHAGDDGARAAMTGSADQRSSAWRSLVLRGLLLGLAYYIGSLLGYAFIFPGSYISIVWPPNTILLVALLVTAWREWVWLLLMVFPVHELVQAQCGASLFAATAYYVFNCILVPIVAGALRRSGGDGFVEVAVSDNGTGIPAEKLPRLFEAFFTTKPQGMGIGLPISRTIIEAHGGRLWAENNPDRGATFHFTLPVAEGGAA